MADVLVVPAAGQGVQMWGRVWGHLTAPVQHPPPLNVITPVRVVHTFDLAMALASNGVRVGDVSLDRIGRAIADDVQSRGLTDIVAVAHGAGAAFLLTALNHLPAPPRRLVLLAGVIPANGRSILSVLPGSLGLASRLALPLHRLVRRDLTVPRPFIFHSLCSTMDTMDAFRYVSDYSALPLRALQDRFTLPTSEHLPPATYAVLEHDKVVPPALQRRMTTRLPNVETISLDACHQAMLEKPTEVTQIIMARV